LREFGFGDCFARNIRKSLLTRRKNNVVQKEKNIKGGQ
jgi:hypothetical protein